MQAVPCPNPLLAPELIQEHSTTRHAHCTRPCKKPKGLLPLPHSLKWHQAFNYYRRVISFVGKKQTKNRFQLQEKPNPSSFSRALHITRHVLVDTCKLGRWSVGVVLDRHRLPPARPFLAELLVDRDVVTRSPRRNGRMGPLPSCHTPPSPRDTCRTDWRHQPHPSLEEHRAHQCPSSVISPR